MCENRVRQAASLSWSPAVPIPAACDKLAACRTRLRTGFRTRSKLVITFFCILIAPLFYSCLKPTGQTGDSPQQASQTLPAEQAKLGSHNKPEITEIGRSNNNRPILAYIFGKGQKNIVVLGGIHGDELSSVALTKAIPPFLEQQSIPTDLTIVVIPAANPDGVSAGTRINAKGAALLERRLTLKNQRFSRKKS